MPIVDLLLHISRKFALSSEWDTLNSPFKNERVQIMTEKNPSAMNSVFGFIWRTFFCFSFYYLIFHLKNPLQKSFFSSNQCQAFTSYNADSEVCKLQKKKMLLAYILLLDTCDTIYVDSFFTMCHTMYHLCSFSTKKKYQIQHLYFKVNIK